jgi:hypothetical protein
MSLVFPLHPHNRTRSAQVETGEMTENIAMRLVAFASVVMVLLGASLSWAQKSAPSDAAPTAPPENLPAPVPGPDSPFAPPPPGPPPLAPTAAPPPSVFSDVGLDGFATRWWLGADYLLWWTKGDRLPALVTSGSPNDAVPGAIGQPGTQMLFGGDYNSRVRSGLRLRGGYWFTPDQTFGVDSTFFFIGGQSASFNDSSAGDPVLTRPFFNVNSGKEDAYIIAYPRHQTGNIEAALSTRLWGADANLRAMLFRGASYQVNLLGGARFLDLHDSLGMKENDIVFPGNYSAPVVWTTVTDHFHTSNQFYGGQVGTDVMWSRGRFFIDVLGKVALGVSVEQAGINGSTSYGTSQGQSGTLGVGALALPSNIGRYSQNRFAVVPEAGVNFGYALTQHIRLTCGYTLLYWSDVFRAGDQIDRGLNPSEVSALVGKGPLYGPARPNFTLQSTDFWAQGLNFGLQFRY